MHGEDPWLGSASASDRNPIASIVPPWFGIGYLAISTAGLYQSRPSNDDLTGLRTLSDFGKALPAPAGGRTAPSRTACPVHGEPTGAATRRGGAVEEDERWAAVGQAQDTLPPRSFAQRQGVVLMHIRRSRWRGVVLAGGRVAISSVMRLTHSSRSRTMRCETGPGIIGRPPE